MAEVNDTPPPDLRSGIPIGALRDGGRVAGRVDDEDALLVRSGDNLYAIGAHCTHYHGPLADGLIVGDTVRCPWHHACFSLRTGEAVRAPALDPVSCWRVERIGDNVFVRDRIAGAGSRTVATADVPASVIVVGGGAAGLAAADMLRREGYQGVAHDDQRGRRAAVRPAESVQGLPCGDCAGRLDTAAAARILFRAPHRSAARHSRCRRSTCGRSACSSKTAGRSISARCCSQRAPTPCASPFRAPGNRRSITFAPLQTVARSSPAPPPPSVRSWSARASSDWRSPPRCARAGSTCTWSAPKACRSSESSDRSSAN